MSALIRFELITDEFLRTRPFQNPRMAAHPGQFLKSRDKCISVTVKDDRFWAFHSPPSLRIYNLIGMILKHLIG